MFPLLLSCLADDEPGAGQGAVTCPQVQLSTGSLGRGMMEAELPRTNSFGLFFSDTFHSISKLMEGSGVSDAGSIRKTRCPQGEQSGCVNSQGVCPVGWQCLMSLYGPCDHRGLRKEPSQGLYLQTPKEHSGVAGWGYRPGDSAGREFQAMLTRFCRDPTSGKSEARV